MRWSRLRWVGLVLVGQILVATGPALAASHDDFMALSLGRGAADLSVQSVVGDIDTGWSGGGKVIHLTVGRQVLSNVVAEVGYGVWRRAPATTGGTQTASLDDVDRYLGAASVAANIYSDLMHLEELALRVGLGYGKGYVSSGGTSTEEWGLLAFLGLQHEWAIDSSFAVGARVDYGYFGGRPALGGKVVFASLFAKILFPKHL